MYSLRIVRVGAMSAVVALLAGCSSGAPLQPVERPLFAQGSPGAPPFVFPAGCCYYQDVIVRTVVPPAHTPQEGRDNFYGFPGTAATGQKGVVGVIPGSENYHGGHWKFFAVTWNVTPYLLTSEADVLAAAAAGDLTVTRIPAMDFRCPIQP